MVGRRISTLHWHQSVKISICFSSITIASRFYRFIGCQCLVYRFIGLDEIFVETFVSKLFLVWESHNCLFIFSLNLLFMWSLFYEANLGTLLFVTPYSKWYSIIGTPTPRHSLWAKSFDVISASHAYIWVC